MSHSSGSDPRPHSCGAIVPAVSIKVTGLLASSRLEPLPTRLASTKCPRSHPSGTASLVPRTSCYRTLTRSCPPPMETPWRQRLAPSEPSRETEAASRWAAMEPALAQSAPWGRSQGGVETVSLQSGAHGPAVPRPPLSSSRSCLMASVVSVTRVTFFRRSGSPSVFCRSSAS